MSRVDDGRVQLRAAGAICWRRAPHLPTDAPLTPATMELLMVRSARWGHWSWPKGKRERGEPAPVAALREVAEETGVRVRLGLPLPALRYLIGDGRLKQVDYWVGHCDGDTTLRQVADPAEIAETAWVPAIEAVHRLEWPAEPAPAAHLFRLAAVHRLTTRALLVVRHAKARKREGWPGSEADRPLTTEGLRQARGLAPLLACWSPEQVLSSPWLRCSRTVAPFCAATGVTWQPAPALTEAAARTHPMHVREEIEHLVDDGGATVVCTHRPVLPDVLKALEAASSPRARAGLPQADPWLRPGEVLVAHLRPGGGGVISVELHRPGITR